MFDCLHTAAKAEIFQLSWVHDEEKCSILDTVVISRVNIVVYDIMMLLLNIVACERITSLVQCPLEDMKWKPLVFH